MSRTIRTGGDWGKAPVYVFDEDDETASTREQEARVLQSHFDRGVMTLDPPVVFLWRHVLEDGIQSGQLVCRLSHVLFPAGLPHVACHLQGEGPLEGRHKLKISLLIKAICPETRSNQT